ncbi:MAG: hypothetical protein EXQ56_06510 [Acidobacteria bacterium]|nr:hypothetical protein [Acidobacteriota bacterium]
MQFIPYEQLNDTPNIIVDGAAYEGTLLTLSHWPHSGTPRELLRDTSAETAFAYLDAPQFHVAAEAVSNNHFDEDGLIGIFALVHPSVAQKYRELLIDAASAGDFGVYRHRDAARIAFTIATYGDSMASPLALDLFELPYPQMAANLYRRLLDLLPRLLTNIADFESLWRDEDNRLTGSEELLDQGEIRIEENPALDLAVVHIPEGLPETTVHRFAQRTLADCHPYALNSRTGCSRMLLVRGRHVEFHYRYESWVQLASRRPPARVDLSPLTAELNQMETSGGQWTFEGVEAITPKLRLEGSPATSLAPDAIRAALESHLATGAAAWNPYD